MIDQISMWQMVTDLCLVTAILVMAFRSVKSSRIQTLIPQLLETEARVAKLIVDTEAAAQHMNDTLLRREQNIYRYLNDLAKNEKEISLSIVEGESLTKELALLTEGAYRESRELAKLIEDAQMICNQEGADSRREENTMQVDPPPQSEHGGRLEIEKEVFSTKTSSKKAAEWIEENFTVETPKKVQKTSSLQRLQNIYKAAEDMLREGISSEEVTEKTGLAPDAVGRLAEMIEIEREEESAQAVRVERPSSDERLGVLGSIRRE